MLTDYCNLFRCECFHKYPYIETYPANYEKDGNTIEPCRACPVSHGMMSFIIIYKCITRSQQNTIWRLIYVHNIYIYIYIYICIDVYNIYIIYIHTNIIPTYIKHRNTLHVTCTEFYSHMKLFRNNHIQYAKSECPTEVHAIPTVVFKRTCYENLSTLYLSTYISMYNNIIIYIYSESEREKVRARESNRERVT